MVGGYGSGRQCGRPTVESGLTLDINRLLRQRNILPGEHVSGSLTWSYTHSGERTASIGYEAFLVLPEAAWARLHYTANGTARDYRVRLEATPCHYGGLRWWWVCPVSGRRTAKLYLPPGATIFAARKAYRLAYRSQREATIDRTHARQARLYRRLGGDYCHYEQPPPPRPKGMHRSTYERLKAELYAAMAAHEEAFTMGASAILARLEKAERRRR
jgi:hypothetical protein